jgi:transposase
MARRESKNKAKTKDQQRRSVGRPPKLSGEMAEQLRALALEHHISVSDLCVLFEQRTGVSINRQTATKYLQQAGLSRARNVRRDKRPLAASGDSSGEVATAPRTYGYSEAHRSKSEGYSTALTDAEWALVSDLFDSNGPGRPSNVSRRAILDACCYVVRTGCAWRLLPNDMPPWQNVYAHFRRWTSKHLFETMNDRFRQMWREREHRTPAPSAAVVDSQSAKSTPQGGPKGFDAGKKVKGRKRHIVTDTLGLLLAVHVTAADVQDRDGAMPVVAQAIAKCPTVKTLFADSAYSGKCAAEIREAHGITVEIQLRPDCKNTPRWTEDGKPTPPNAKGFIPIKKRWVIERTNSWTDRSRRLSKEYDRRVDVSESWIWLTHAKVLMHRIALAAA